MGSALVLSPEAPYPTRGGGAIRTASLIEYLRRRYASVDLIVFSEAGATPPDGATATVELKRHSRSHAARAGRNLVRFVAGTPPLIDRFSGCGAQIARAMGTKQYDVAVLEHMWTAGYLDLARTHAERVVLDLHNIESTLHTRYARGVLGPVHRRWAASARRLEAEILPGFDAVLTASEQDAAAVAWTGARTVVYPNALPPRDPPRSRRTESIVFSGNLEYPPNLEAVGWFAERVWPALSSRFPSLEWRIVGSNEGRVRRLVRGVPRVVLTGPVEDAVEEIGRSAVAVAPIFSGSGTRVKILEAWAACVPVIATPLGAEGLRVGDGEHILLADDPAGFIAAIARLLESPADRDGIGMAGHRLLETDYTWPVAWKSLDAAGI